jgi:hypothetical protein
VDDVKSTEANLHTIEKKKIEALGVTSKEVDTEINKEILSMCMSLSCHLNREHDHDINKAKQ